MRLSLLAMIGLLQVVACTPDGPLAPVGTFTLDAASTRAFTETHYRTQRGLDEPDARAMGARLAAELHGTVQLGSDGAGVVHVEDSSGTVAHVAGGWTQTDRHIALTGQEPGSGTLELDWIDGSRALRLEISIGEDEAILMFQAPSGAVD